MRKLNALLLTVLAILCCFYQAEAVNRASVPIENIVLQPTVGDLVGMKAREYAQYTGQKFSLKERIAFGLVKGHLKHGLRKGTLRADDSVNYALAKDNSSNVIGAILLVWFLGPIGLIIALIAFKHNKQAKKAAWYTMAVMVLFLVLFVAFCDCFLMFGG